MTASPRVKNLVLLVAVLAALGYYVATWDSRQSPVLAGVTLANMTAEERTVIANGRVSVADHQRIVRQSITCMRGLGAEVHEVKHKDGQLGYETGYKTNIDGSGGPSQARMDDCSRLSEAVRAVWIVDHEGRPYPHLREMVTALRNAEARRRQSG